MKVIVALILNECFRNIKSNGLLNWIENMLSLLVSPGASRICVTPSGLLAGAGNLPVFNETQTKNVHFGGRSWKIIRIVTFHLC